jgi:branched-subunit amino acid transport protein
METEREGKNAAITAIRRWARVLGVIPAGFFLFMAIGEALQSHTPIKPLAANWLGLAGIYAVAMFLALKWERAAVLVGVAALLAAHVDGLFLGLFEYPGHLTLVSVVNPFLLVFWVPVLLYLRCWRLEGRARRKAVL